MRVIIPAIALSAVLATGITGSTLLAQDQSQTGTASTQAPAAGTGHHHAADPQREAKRMAKKLNLSSDQEAKIEPILADREQQIQGAHADTSMSPQDKHAKMQSIHQDSNSRIEKILNDQQKQQYEQMQQNRHEKRQGAGATS